MASRPPSGILDGQGLMGYLGAGNQPPTISPSPARFLPDFSNGSNRAESYARSVSGIEAPGERKVLPVFLKYLRKTTDKLGEGLELYRAAALASPEAKRAGALREVIVAEQQHRMLLSSQAILTFEDKRLQLMAETDPAKARVLLDEMEAIVRDEIARGIALIAVTHDSRIGFQFECDYVYSPYSLRETMFCAIP